jgi:polysaccharide biosynthesis PFTS motif protein
MLIESELSEFNLSEEISDFAAQTKSASADQKNRADNFGFPVLIENRKRQIMKSLEFYFILFIAVIRILNGKSRNQMQLNLLFGINSSLIEKPKALNQMAQNVLGNKFGLCDRNFLIVEYKSWRLHSRAKNQKIVIDIGLELFSRLLTRREKVKILWKALNRYSQYRKKTSRHLRSYIPIKEYCFYEPVFEKIELGKIQNLITTQSHALIQPLIFHYLLKFGRTRQVMIWYSSNNVRIHKRIEPELIQEDDYSWLSVAAISKHYVWTENQKIFLSQFCDTDIEVSGPFVFHKNDILGTRVVTPYDVLIFDVTPRQNMTESNIYAAKYLSAFMSEVVTIAKGLALSPSIKLFLKPKRKYESTRDANYVALINKLSSNRVLRVLDPHFNLYAVIAKSKLVICYPFTSPALIAKTMGKRVVFYIPDNALDFLITDDHEGVKVIKGSKALQSYLEFFYESRSDDVVF